MSIASSLAALQAARDDIANAIAAMGGTVNEGDGFADFADDIGTIPSGGVTETEPKDVNFYDYNGVCVYAYTLEEAAGLTALPEAPDHSSDDIPLIFDEWNFTLAQVNALTSKCSVGANYRTTDGKTHLVIKINEKDRKVVPLYFSQDVSNGVTIDWGDGTSTTKVSGTGYVNTSHTYAAAGTYDITLDADEGCTLILGSNTSFVSVLGTTYGQTSNYSFCPMLRAARLAAGVSISSYGFYSCVNMGTVSLPGGITLGARAFMNCCLLKTVTVPKGITTLNGYTFNNCYSLKATLLPHGITTLGEGEFQNCYNLKSAVLPGSVSSINSGVFQMCTSLTEVTIPEGAKVIGGSQHRNNYSLSSIVIPASVESIGLSAFEECYNMAHYYFYPTTPPVLASTYIFGLLRADCVFHVPAASLTAYQSAQYWSGHAARMAGDL